MKFLLQVQKLHLTNTFGWHLSQQDLPFISKVFHIHPFLIVNTHSQSAIILFSGLVTPITSSLVASSHYFSIFSSFNFSLHEVGILHGIEHTSCTHPQYTKFIIIKWGINVNSMTSFWLTEAPFNLRLQWKILLYWNIITKGPFYSIGLIVLLRLYYWLWI